MLGELLCLFFLVGASGGFLGWQFRGWFDRRMRPAVPDEPKTVCTSCLARKWGQHLGCDEAIQ